MTRGNKRDVDHMTQFLETRAFPLLHIDKKENKTVVPMTGILQPVQLWSYVFPEVSKDAVLTGLKFDDENIKRWESNAKLRGLTYLLRKAMGASKIPKFEPNNSMLMPLKSMENIAIMPIGVKHDDLNWWDEKSKTIHEAI